ncbi:hypothetical protein J2S10_003819 [Neobacillus ginsengisoli]|uniref:Uncharacterized protein n=1 Tax=Neobacillus ginsengisoli TaxID=904295 RepID=A0ABT9XYH5_9BACI|nr:hypothetical protein [Neobacillus ginsengisoli]
MLLFIITNLITGMLITVSYFVNNKPFFRKKKKYYYPV